MRHRADSTSQPRYPSGWSIPAQLAVVRFFKKRKRRIRGDILVSGYGSRLLLCRFGVPRGCRYCRRPRRLGGATSAGWLPPHCKPRLIPSLKPFELPASVLRAAAPAGGRGTAGATRAGDQGAEIARPFHSPRRRRVVKSGSTLRSPSHRNRSSSRTLPSTLRRTPTSFPHPSRRCPYRLLLLRSSSYSLASFALPPPTSVTMSQMAAFVGAALGVTLRTARTAAISGRRLSISSPAFTRVTAPVRVRDSSPWAASFPTCVALDGHWRTLMSSTKLEGRCARLSGCCRLAGS